MDPSHSYSEEDWLVHSQFGIGQIVGIEIKSISGEEADYFKIQTTDCTYWVPVGQMDSDKMRPVTTPAEIQLVIAILQRPSQQMSADHIARKNRMRSVQRQNTLQDVARLIRDLRARQLATGKYNLDENTLLRDLKQRLVEEWSLVTGKNAEAVSSKLDALLDQQQLSEG